MGDAVIILQQGALFCERFEIPGRRPRAKRLLVTLVLQDDDKDVSGLWRFLSGGSRYQDRRRGSRGPRSGKQSSGQSDETPHAMVPNGKQEKAAVKAAFFVSSKPRSVVLRKVTAKPV